MKNLTASAPESRGYVQTRRAEAAAETGERIIEAATELFFASGEVPTLESVAARAAVSVQTVLRRYGSKDGLFAACTKAATSSVEAQRGAAVAGDVDGAIDNLLEHYQAWGDRSLFMLALEGKSAVAATVVQRGRRLHKAWVKTVFEPLLAGFDEQTRVRRLAQLVMVTDVFAWKLLHRDQRLSREETRLAMIELAQCLVASTILSPPSTHPKTIHPAKRASK